MKCFRLLAIGFLGLIHSLLAKDTPQAKFQVSVSKSQVYACECYVVTASFLVSHENKVPLQFYELEHQVWTVRDALTPEDAWIYSNDISEVKAIYSSFKGSYFHQYKLVEMGICPTKAGEITIPVLDLVLAKVDTKGNFLDSLVFQSESHGITVQSLPDNVKDYLYANDFYQMVGEFQVKEDFKHIRKSFPMGDTINYKFSLLGNAVSFPIDLNLSPPKGIDITLKAISQSDTIISNKLKAKKTFHLQIVSYVKDTLHLGDYVQWQYFSPKEKKVKVVKPEVWFFTWGRSTGQLPKPVDSKNNHDLVVVLDISESMFVEDYGTDRLTKGIELVNTILQIKKDAPLVVFAGAVNVLYIDQIDYDVMRYGRKKGTAIGNAIWQAKEILKKSHASQKNIILIGDGEDTGSALSETMSAQMAHAYGITIHCIGIGHEGIVPFGFDLLGYPKFVIDTYQQTSLEKVAKLTGGRFVHLEMESNMNEIVNTIIK